MGEENCSRMRCARVMQSKKKSVDSNAIVFRGERQAEKEAKPTLD